MAAEEKKNVENTEVKAGAEKCETAGCPKAPKKVWRILGWCFAGLAAVLLLAFIFRDVLVKQSVCNVGTFVVGTKVEMASFKSSLKGSVELKGIKVANPAGYYKPYAFEIDSIFIKIDPLTLATSEPVVEVVKISGVRVDWEQKGLRKNNLTDIQKNLERFAGAGSEKKKQQETDDKKGNGVSPLLKSVSITSMELSLSSSAIGNSLSLPLVPIYLNDIGGKGKSLGESLLEIYNRFMGGVNTALGGVADGIEFIGDAGKSVGSGLQKGASAIGDAGKSIGSGFKSVGKGVSDLFQGK